MISQQKIIIGVWDSGLGFGEKLLIVIDLLQGYTTEGSALAPGVVECVKEVPDLLGLAREKCACDSGFIHKPITRMEVFDCKKRC